MSGKRDAEVSVSLLSDSSPFTIYSHQSSVFAFV